MTGRGMEDTDGFLQLGRLNCMGDQAFGDEVKQERSGVYAF